MDNDDYKINWKKIDGVNYCTIGQAGKYLKRSAQTIKNWAEWYDCQSDEIKKENPFPEFKRDVGKRATRFISEHGLHLLEKFKGNLEYGKMTEISRKKWAKK